MIRKIYMIEKIDWRGVLVARRYARNLKTAAKIQAQLGIDETHIYTVKKEDFRFINFEWIEG